MMIDLPPCNKVARRTYMLALFPGCSQAQVYPVLVTQQPERNFTKHMVNMGREMGNLQIAIPTHIFLK